jgi:hypothetical protein
MSDCDTENNQTCSNLAHQTKIIDKIQRDIEDIHKTMIRIESAQGQFQLLQVEVAQLKTKQAEFESNKNKSI